MKLGVYISPELIVLLLSRTHSSGEQQWHRFYRYVTFYASQNSDGIIVLFVEQLIIYFTPQVRELCSYVKQPFSLFFSLTIFMLFFFSSSARAFFLVSFFFFFFLCFTFLIKWCVHSSSVSSLESSFLNFCVMSFTVPNYISIVKLYKYSHQCA